MMISLSGWLLVNLVIAMVVAACIMAGRAMAADHQGPSARRSRSGLRNKGDWGQDIQLEWNRAIDLGPLTEEQGRDLWRSA